MSSILDHETLQREARRLRKDPALADEVRQYDNRSRRKVYLLNAVFVATLALWLLAGENTWLIVPLILVNGTFALPYLRVFIHSEAHWGLGTNRAQTWYLRYLAFASYQVPFEAYRLGHFAHHRYDNDVPNRRALALDRQSTYLYSSKGVPVNFAVWALHYLFAYQYLFQIRLVVSKSSLRKLAEFIVQASIIAGLDIALFLLSPTFFLRIFLPSLALAWLGSAIVLYMMHNIPKDDAVHHHSVNSYHGFFNRFGDNDGLHIVHSMFPFLHPFHTKAIDDMLRSDLHPAQIVEGHYVAAFFRRPFRRGREGRVDAIA